jgi:hypothetical protein
MLPAQTVRRARRLLAAGDLSHRAIARRLHISRAIVADIARGDRNDDGSDKIIQRCPRCGEMAEAPCKKCNHVNVPRSACDDADADDLSFQLKPHHERARLEIVLGLVRCHAGQVFGPALAITSEPTAGNPAD